jgi:sialic acid synthase
MKIELTPNRFIGDGFRPYIMAEVGINHNGEFEKAKLMIEEAARTGADAVKFQKRTLNEMYTKAYLSTPYVKENSFGSTYGSHKEFLEFSDDELLELKSIADYNNITFSVSGFDFSGFEFIENVLKVPFHKIASPLVTHYPLLKYVASFKKPMIISTGMHDYEEVSDMIKFVKSINKQIVLLQCTTSYPTEDSDVNLRVIERYKKDFDVLAGYSSHDRGVVLPAASIVLGSCFIEKHFTFDRMAKGPDHISSVETRGLDLIIKYANSVFYGLGSNEKNLCKSEIENKIKHGYSCVAFSNISRGSVLTEEMLSYKQPGGGILPKDIESILGRRLNIDVQIDHKFSLDDFQE